MRCSPKALPGFPPPGKARLRASHLASLKGMRWAAAFATMLGRPGACLMLVVVPLCCAERSSPAPMSKELAQRSDTAGAPTLTGVNAAAAITEGQWLDLQLNVACLRFGAIDTGSPDLHSYCGPSFAGDAILLSYVMSRRPGYDLGKLRYDVEASACRVFTFVQVPSWIKELRLELDVLFLSVRSPALNPEPVSWFPGWRGVAVSVITA